MTTPMQAEGKRSAPTPVRRVVLVGFMGSGKTSVGRALAERLGWGFRDLDEEISTELGLSIPEIFQQHGEDFFRSVEGRLGEELLKEERVVLASGGGWPMAPGRMEGLPPGTLSVWLKISAEEAVRRTGKEGPTRPLLAVSDPVERARRLLEEREASYARARVTVDSEGAMPEDLARRIEDWVNQRGRGWASSRTPEA
jgi:shikimate kinase